MNSGNKLTEWFSLDLEDAIDFEFSLADLEELYDARRKFIEAYRKQKEVTA